MRNHFDHVRRLLELGAPIDVSVVHHPQDFADINCRSWIGKMPVHFIMLQDSMPSTVSICSWNIGHRLIDKMLMATHLWHCLARSRFENQRTAHLLFHQLRPSSLDIQNEDCQSVLSVACEHGQTRSVEMLLAHGANVSCSMPMHMAIKGGHLGIVQLLLDYPSSLSSTKSSLHLACRYNRIDILRILLERSHLDLEMRDEQGYTPLLTASAFNHLDCLKLLLNHSADITASRPSEQKCMWVHRLRRSDVKLWSSLQCISVSNSGVEQRWISVWDGWEMMICWSVSINRVRRSFMQVERWK